MLSGRRVLVAAVVCSLLAPVTALASPECEARAWTRGLPGIGFGSLLYAASVYDDGSGPALYIGGLIDDPAEGVAKLQGNAFAGVGGGVHHFGGGYVEVHAMTVYNGELIVAGDFSLAGAVPAANIARWNGARWAALGEGSHEIIYALVVHDGQLIAGNKVWDGTSWTPLMGGAHIGTPLALASYNGELYAGGDHAPFIARWTGSAWAAVGGGTNHHVEALTIFDGELVAGGFFSAAGGVATGAVARWNGSTWAAVGTPGEVGGAVTALTVYQDTLIAGGWFRRTTAGSAWMVARWNRDGSGAWTNMGTGFYYSRIDDSVHAFTAFEGDLVAVGVFPAIPGFPATDNWGRWGCAAQPNQAPTAAIAGPLTGQVNRNVTIWGTTSSDPDGDGLEFHWQFGDGTSSSGLPRAIGHAYAAPGTYTVTLVVHDGELASAPATTTVTIIGVNQPPSVTLTSPSSGTPFEAPATVPLAASASDFDGTIQRVEFHNGATLLGVDSVVPYSFAWTGVAAGRYTVRAVAYDNGGASATSTANVVVAAAIAPAADAYVRDGSSANTNFGKAATLETRTGTSGNTRWTYLKFDTATVTAAGTAKLRIFGALNQTSGVQVRTAAYPVSSSGWNEATLTWNNRPSSGPAALATVTLANSTTGRWYELDITQYVKQEKAAGRHVITIALKNTTTSTSQAVFRSREAAANKPQLAIAP